MEDPKWAFNNIIKFLQYQKERIENKEISGGTLSNFVKTIKLFCEMSEIPIHWKKITRGLPKSRKYADDRAPAIEEIKKLVEYPDRRIKPIVYCMVSGGFRIGSWDYLKWKHIIFLNNKKEYDKLAELHSTVEYYAKIVESYGFDMYSDEFNKKMFPITKEDKQMENISNGKNYSQALS